ncbi:uncharacterized protein [Diadema setosum]|uniref:uncharacterized protein n=1 Tax=Diadema setosum TaxID=31175 RepID=UPI003B3B56A8
MKTRIMLNANSQYQLHHSKKLFTASPQASVSQRRIVFLEQDENQPAAVASSSLSSEVAFNDGRTSRRKTLPFAWNGVAAALCHGDEMSAVKQVVAMDIAQKEVDNAISVRIQNEVTEMCRATTKSAFRGSSVDDMLSFDYKEQEQELKETAPTFFAALQTAAVAPRVERNIRKTKESLQPRVMIAAGVLLNCRSQNMNAHQALNALTLKEGAAKKSTFRRLNAKGISSSYDTTLRIQTECGKDYDVPLKQWAMEVHEDSEKERVFKTMCDTEKIDELNATRTSSYQLVMDNVDMVVRARHPTRENFGKDHHMVQLMAVQHRVSAWHLPCTHPVATLESFDNKDLLPNMQDNAQLKHDWMVLSARMIAEHIPSLKPMMDLLPQVIVHDHMTEMKEKSKVVNLGVLMENENTSEGILKILHHMHAYVPGDASSHPTRILSAGDLLTCERESNCIEQQRNSTTPSRRMEGLVPVIADFHALANFYKVIWKHLYDASSAADTGTLYSARNFLQARNVTTNPMDNINAAADLMMKFTTALVLAAALHYFGLEDISAEPTKQRFNLQEHGNVQQHAEATMSKFVDTYMLPTESEIDMDHHEWICSSCGKKYMSRKGLLKHERSKHPGAPGPKDQHPSNQDGVFNYTRCALGMGMLAHDFNDARQMGDGERIIRLYKLLLLHCRAANKPKYSFHILRLLAQVKCFLSPRLAYELTWNRFVNSKGKIGCNVEVDRAMEHRNRIFKESCHGLRGHITQQSVDRVSRSAQIVHDLLTNVDAQISVKKDSAKRQETGHRDVDALAKILNDEDIFVETAGRKHSKFPDFPVNVLSALDISDLHRWISTTLKSLSRQNQFQHV